MNSNFTTEHLIRFLYKEMNPQEVAELQNELLHNEQLRNELQQLKETHSALGKEQHEPDDTSVHLVLDYSASYYSAPEHYTE